MGDCICKNIKSAWRCLLTAVMLYFTIHPQQCFAISPEWIVDNHEILAAYNPAAAINPDEKCRLNIIGSLSRQTRSATPQYYLFQGCLPITTDYINLAIGLDADYYKSGNFNFKQAHLQIAGSNNFKCGNISYGIAPGFYTSITSSNSDFKLKRNRFSLNGGVMFENKLLNLGISATQLFTGQNSRGHIYGRMTIPINIIELIPSVMLTTDFSYSRTDLLGQLRFFQKFTIGAGWSTSRFAAVTARVDVKDFYIGYAFAFPDHSSENKIFNHEIFAGYSLKISLNESTRYISKSIRYM